MADIKQGICDRVEVLLFGGKRDHYVKRPNYTSYRYNYSGSQPDFRFNAYMRTEASMFVDELKEDGILLDALRNEARSKNPEVDKMDDFDLVCHLKLFPYLHH